MSLEAVAQEEFQASHPVSLPLPTIYNVLSGVQVQEPQQLFQKLLSGNAEALNLFSEPNISFLARGIQTGLQQASPKEVIRFTLFHAAQAASDATEGLLYHHDSKLYLTLTKLPSSFQTHSNSTRSKKQLKDVNSLRSKKLTFTPETALRSSSDFFHPQEVTHGNTLVIHYSSLFGTPDQTQQPDQASSRPESDTPIRQKDAHIPLPQDSKTLKGVVIQQQQEIHDLRKELDNIQRDLQKTPLP